MTSPWCALRCRVRLGRTSIRVHHQSADAVQDSNTPRATSCKPRATYNAKARRCSLTWFRGGGNVPRCPVGSNPMRRYSATAGELSSVTSNRSRVEPAARAHSATAFTSSRPTPRPRASGATHIDRRKAFAGALSSEAPRANPMSLPLSLATNVARSSSWRRQSEALRASASSSVLLKASGASPSAARRSRRRRRQSSGKSR